MTKITEVPRRVLEERRERFLAQCNDLLNAGDFARYCKLKARIARITSELGRRDGLARRHEWERYAPQ